MQQPMLAITTASIATCPTGAVVVELDAVRARHAEIPEEVLEEMARVADLLDEAVAAGRPVALDLHALERSLVAELLADLSLEDPWPTRP